MGLFFGQWRCPLHRCWRHFFLPRSLVPSSSNIRLPGDLLRSDARSGGASGSLQQAGGRPAPAPFLSSGSSMMSCKLLHARRPPSSSAGRSRGSDTGSDLAVSLSCFRRSGAGRAAWEAPQGCRQLAVPGPGDSQGTPRGTLLCRCRCRRRSRRLPRRELSSDRNTRRAAGAFRSPLAPRLGQCGRCEVCDGSLVRLHRDC